MALDKITRGIIADDAIDATKIEANSIDSSELVDGSIDTSHLGNLQVTAAKVAADVATQAELDLKATKVELDAARQDITILALREAVTENRVAYTSTNSFIDTFEDSTGVGTFTTTTRDDSGEFVATNSVATYGLNSNTKILLHMEDTGLDDSSGQGSITTALSGNYQRSSSFFKWGSYSANAAAAGDYLTFGGVPYPGSTLWGFDFWWRPTSLPTSVHQSFFACVTDGQWVAFRYNGASDKRKLLLEVADNDGGWMSPGSHIGAKNDFAVDTWYHIALSRVDSTTIKWWVDGVLDATKTIASGVIYAATQPRLSQHGGWDIPVFGYMDEFRLQMGESPQMTSGDPLYISSGTGFTRPTQAYIGGTVTATGTVIGNTNVPSSAQTKVSGVMLYKDASGTATLGTDLKIYFTCIAGDSNWVEAASYTTVTPVFSTGIKMVKLGETTCTSGSDIRYKVVWANQVVDTKVTQLHGIGLNY